MSGEEPSMEFPDCVIAKDDEGRDVILGKGATGTVYKVYHRGLEKNLALKVVRHDKIGYQEAAVLFKIQHDNIVKVHWTSQLPDGGFWYAMELIDGPTLKTHLAGLDDQKMDPAEAVRLSLQAARALECAHANQAFHRDVKPDNIMLARDKDGRFTIKLIDFGSFVRGTPDYASPEQLEDRDDNYVGGAWDVYALGSTLWEMLVGYPPFQNPERSVDSATVQACKQISDPDWEALERLPHDLQDLLKHALCEDPRQRIRTATDFAARLEGLKLEEREFACRKVSPLVVRVEELDGGERLRATRVSTHFRARHPEHGPLGLLNIRAVGGIDLARLKEIWSILKRKPLEHLLFTHLVEASPDGRTFSVVTEPWWVEDSLRQLLGQRGGKLEPDALKSFGFPVLHAIARTVDEMKELGLPSPDLSSLTISLEKSRNELVPPAGRLRIIPWNVSALQQGTHEPVTGAGSSGDTTVVNTDDTLVDAGGSDPAALSLARLFYEMLGESTSILPTGALRVTGSINQSAFRFLERICKGDYAEGTTCAKLFQELETLYWGGSGSHHEIPSALKEPKPKEPEPKEPEPKEPEPKEPEPKEPEPKEPEPEKLDPEKSEPKKPNRGPDPGGFVGGGDSPVPAPLANLPTTPQTKNRLAAVLITLLLVGSAAYLFKDYPKISELLQKLRGNVIVVPSDHLGIARQHRDANRHADAINAYVQAAKADPTGVAEQELTDLMVRLSQDPGLLMPPSNIPDTRQGYQATLQAVDGAIAADVATQAASALKTALSTRLQKVDQALKEARDLETVGTRDQALGGMIVAVREYREFPELLAEAEGMVSRIGRDVKLFTPAQIASLLKAIDEARTLPVNGADAVAKLLRDELGNRYALRAQAAVEKARNGRIGEGLDELVALSSEVKNLPEIGSAAAEIAELIAAKREAFLDFNPFRNGVDYFDSKFGGAASFNLTQLEKAATELDSPALMRELALLGPEADKQLWLQKAGASGDAAAKFHYARILCNDDLVLDGATARQLLREAWDLNYLAAGPMLAMCLIDGVGGEKDPPGAEVILKAVLAARPDDSEAHLAMGRFHQIQNKLPEAFTAFENAMTYRSTWLRVVQFNPANPKSAYRFDPFTAALRIQFLGGAQAKAQEIALQGAWAGSARCGYVTAVFLEDAATGKNPAVIEETLTWLQVAATLGDAEAQAELKELKFAKGKLPDLAPTLEKFAQTDKSGSKGGWEYIQALLAFRAGNEDQGRLLMKKSAAKSHPFATRWCQRH